MKPIKFKEQNCTFAEGQPQYLNLPAYRHISGEVITCWRFSFLERLRILFKGKMWHSTMTFNKPLQPLCFTTKKSDILIVK